MLLECARCGAPLVAKGTARRTKCRYCGAVDERERLRVKAAETPKDYKPPKVWVPPPDAKVSPSQPLKYQEPSFGLVMASSALLLAVAFGLSFLIDSPMWNTSPDVLMRGSPVGPHAEVAKRLKGKSGSTTVSVELKASRYQKAEIRYANASDVVPTSMALELKAGEKADAAAKDALSKRLNGGLDEGGNWQWGDARISVSREGLYASLDANGDPALRERRARAMWSILLGAAFNQSLGPTRDEMRAVLGGGYPVADLAKLSPETTIDRAKGMVLTTFPGALVEDARQMRLRIAIDHPLFSSVELHYFVMAGGTMSDVDIPGKPALTAARASVARCLSQTLGQPRETVEDPVAGTKTYTFVPGRGWLDLSRGLTLHAYDGHNAPAPIDAQLWQTVVAAVDRCRG